jgi:hypothetical protein
MIIHLHFLPRGGMSARVVITYVFELGRPDPLGFSLRSSLCISEKIGAATYRRAGILTDGQVIIERMHGSVSGLILKTQGYFSATPTGFPPVFSAIFVARR